MSLWLLSTIILQQFLIDVAIFPLMPHASALKAIFVEPKARPTCRGWRSRPHSFIVPGLLNGVQCGLNYVLDLNISTACLISTLRIGALLVISTHDLERRSTTTLLAHVILGLLFVPPIDALALNEGLDIVVSLDRPILGNLVLPLSRYDLESTIIQFFCIGQ